MDRHKSAAKVKESLRIAGVLERVRDFFAGPEKCLISLFFTFFHLHSRRYAPEKTRKTG